MRTDFRERLDDIVSDVAVPGYVVNPASIEVAEWALHAIEARYGPDSDSPLAYHNADHALDVCRRAVRLTNVVYPYLKPEHHAKIFDLAIVCGAGHDLEQSLGSGANERASAEAMMAKVLEIDDPVINNKKFLQRMKLGILATEVHRNEEGELVQTNLRTGSRDPIKLIMANADINGIAMEGNARMIRDVTHLCQEAYGEPTAEQYYKFLIDQAGFLRQRLHDEQIIPDITYFFPDDADAVYRDTRKLFQGNIVDAYRLALFMEQHPDITASIGTAAKRVGTTHVGKLITRSLKNRLA